MTPEQKQVDFQLQIEDLDFHNAATASHALGIAAQSIRELGRPSLEPAVRFLWTIAVAMSDKACQRAESEGLKPQRTQAELEQIIEKQERSRLN